MSTLSQSHYVVGRNSDFTAAADFIADHVESFAAMKLPVDTAINVKRTTSA